MLTNAAAKAAAPQARAYKLFDAGGLFLLVAPTGLKSWRLKFRRGGREQLRVLGRWPDMSLADARIERDACKAALHSGTSFQGEKSDTFAAIARAWHRHNLPRWSPAHAADVLASLERDVLPVIGEMPIGTITAPDLLACLHRLERRGVRATARRLRQRLSAIFGFAMATGLANDDPAARLGRAMQGATLVRQHPALVTIDDCRALLTACETIPSGCSTQLASRFLALTAVRLDAVRGLRWDELEDLDGPAPLWRVPAARMKLSRIKKAVADYAHLVPLSAAAVAVLRLAAAASPPETCASARVWPSAGLVFRRAAKNSSIEFPIGEGAIRDLYIRAGYGGRHVPHGWRASFSTILNEAAPDLRSDIDRALAHVPKDKVEAAYNRAEQLGRRRALFDQWGALLTS